MANAEMMAKANEKRMNALERKLDTFEKDFRKNGDMSALIKRIKNLETAVKALAVTAKSSGHGDGKVQNEIADIKSLIDKRDKKILALQNSVDPNSDKKIANLEKRREVLEKTVTALNGRAERDKKEYLAQMEKIGTKVEKQAKKLAETAVLESRLKVLEGLVQAALKK